MSGVSMVSSRSVRVQRHSRGGPSLAAIACVPVVVFVLGVGFVWSRTELVAAAMRTAEMERTERELEMRENQLLTRVAALRNPSRLEKVAREKAGLVVRTPAQVFHVDPDILEKTFGRGGGKP